MNKYQEISTAMNKCQQITNMKIYQQRSIDINK
jgi:hypothetical protein